jgi:pimeloyl-ACP methyl ester carboxylesterase
MRNFKFKRLITLAAVSSLLTVTIVSVPTVAQAAPVCTTAGTVTTCTGKTSDDAEYTFKVPANYNGTVFHYSRGWRPNYPVPAGIPVYGGLPLATNAFHVWSNSAELEKYLLDKGFGMMGSGFARQGWNAVSAFKTNTELLGVFKKQFTETDKVIAYGDSQGGFLAAQLAEKYPDQISAAGNVCGVKDIVKLFEEANHMIWLLKTLFDPSIKGGNYSAGQAGYVEVMTDLGKAWAVLSSLATAMSVNALAPAWPATSAVPAPLKSAIPSRSAAVLTNLLVGLPMQSGHFDNTSAPPGADDRTAFGYQLAISPAFAALENWAPVLGFAFMGIYDAELEMGPGFFDNTATDYAARLGDDRYIWTQALSGEGAIDAMLAYLAMAPRVKGVSATAAKAPSVLGALSGELEVPIVIYANLNGPVLGTQNHQAYIDKYQAYYDGKWAANKKAGIRKRPVNNLLALWNFPPEKWTKFSATGSPIGFLDLASDVTGNGHCNHTVKEWKTIFDLMAHASDTGKNLSGGALYTKLRKTGYMTYDREYIAPSFKS